MDRMHILILRKWLGSKSMNIIQAIKEPSLQRKWLFFFFVGICIGVLFANLLGGQYMDQISLLSDYLIQKYRASEVRSGELFWYCLQTRILPMCYIWIFGLTMFGRAVGYWYVTWFGFSTGALLSIATMRFGAKGILLCIAGMLPQYLFYIPAIVILLLISSGTSRKLYGGGRSGQAVYGGRKKLIGLYFTIFAVIVVVCIIGIFTESYVNPFIIKKIIKIF